MNTTGDELERWLAGEDIFACRPDAATEWFADFDADRQLVIARLGPYRRLFLRPKKFTRRFYHQLYPLPIEHWPYHRQFRLFDDFCTVDMHLDLRFQATLTYAQTNSEVLPDINIHIRANYAGLLDELFTRELQYLEDGVWVQTGLADMEKRIANSVRELLAIQQIQSQALLRINARFETFPAVKPGPDNVYLQVMKKSYEITSQQQQEAARQNILQEQHSQLEKQRLMRELQQQTELAAQEQALLAEKQLRLLNEKREQIARQQVVEKTLRATNLRHQTELKAMHVDSELAQTELQREKQRQMESRQQVLDLAHAAEMEERKILAEIRRMEAAEQLRRQKITFVPDNIQI